MSRCYIVAQGFAKWLLPTHPYVAYNQVICYNPKSSHDYSIEDVEETSFPFKHLPNAIPQFNTEPHNSEISWVVTHY